MTKTIVYTTLAMSAFAANSIICRLALGADAIDARSFTAIRLVSGALLLWLIATLSGGAASTFKMGNSISAAALFFYAAGFSFAYQTLNTGTGAVILFGSVQITMILYSIFTGNVPGRLEWLGLATALTGFVFLVLPGVSTPQFSGFILMAVAGIAWAIYTLRGRSTTNPLVSTAGNFIFTVPLAILLHWLMESEARISAWGVILATFSGSLASAAGYALWYSVLPRLTVTEAAVIQLSAPVLATIGGIVFMSEMLTVRFGISTLLVLGGILAVVFGRQKRNT